MIAIGNFCLDLVKERLQLYYLITIGAPIGNEIVQHGIERHQGHATQFEPVAGRKLLENSAMWEAMAGV